MVIKKPFASLPIIQSRKGSRQSLDKPEDVRGRMQKVSETFRHLYGHRSGGNVKYAKCTIIGLVSIALIAMAWGIYSLIHTPLQMLLSFRLQMTPGLPPYEWWQQPPDEVLLKTYIFNVTNSERFVSGLDRKLHVQEVGPIVFREKLRHTYVKFNPNGTLTYTANRTAVYLPERNTISLNATIVVPNLAVLLTVAHFHDSSMFVKLGLNVILRSLNSQPLLKMSIHDYLWNATDSILDSAEQLAPSLVPTKNVGLLNIIYKDFENNVTVFVGDKHGNHKFFTIDTYDGSEYLPHFANSDCPLRFRNASEGLSYPQMVEKHTNLSYWRRTLCKEAEIRYAKDESKYGIDAYRFEMVPWAFNRTNSIGKKDCYSGSPTLPDGIADVSPCYWGFPIGASYPHYLYADERVTSRIEGLRPRKEDHAAYVLIEPVTGIPLEGKAGAQINLIMRKFWGFPSHIQPFSDINIPLAWLEYHQEGVPWYIRGTVFFTAVLLPICQLPLSILSLSIGALCIFFCMRSFLRNKEQSKSNCVVNKLLDEGDILIEGDSIL